jgi:hypothetical protein
MTKGTPARPTNIFDPDHASSTGWHHARVGAGQAGHGAPAAGAGATTGATTKLTVTFNSEEAGYSNSMGWYNARTGQAGILFQDLNDDGRNAAIHAGDTRNSAFRDSFGLQTPRRKPLLRRILEGRCHGESSKCLNLLISCILDSKRCPLRLC